MSIFTKEEREQLDLVHSGTTFVQVNQCMVCKAVASPGPSPVQSLNSISYLLPYTISISRMLIFCQNCEKKAKYVYIRECIATKKLPTAIFREVCNRSNAEITYSPNRFERQREPTPLFDPEYEFKVIRTNGDESVGKLEYMRNLGWSSSQNEITAWVSLDGSQTTKPLVLSLLFEANPQLRDFVEFKNGLVLTFEYVDMFKTEFPDFYNKIQTAVKQLNEKFFSDRV